MLFFLTNKERIIPDQKKLVNLAKIWLSVLKFKASHSSGEQRQKKEKMQNIKQKKKKNCFAGTNFKMAIKIKCFI